MSRMEVPDVERMENAVNLGGHANGSAKGKENSGITPRMTLSKKG